MVQSPRVHLHQKTVPTGDKRILIRNLCEMFRCDLGYEQCPDGDNDIVVEVFPTLLLNILVRSHEAFAYFVFTSKIIA